jgi:hypothetical protein
MSTYAESLKKRRASKLRWYHKNREYCIEKQRLYREANRERIRAYQRVAPRKAKCTPQLNCAVRLEEAYARRLEAKAHK